MKMVHGLIWLLVEEGGGSTVKNLYFSQTISEGIPNTTYTIYNPDTIIHNPDGIWSAGIGTIPSMGGLTGILRVQFCLLGFNTTGTVNTVCVVTKNGSVDYYAIQRTETLSNQRPKWDGNVSLPVVAGDTFQFKLYHDAGPSNGVINSSGIGDAVRIDVELTY